MSLIQNKRVSFDYQILGRFEAGIELFGFEVKSIRAGVGSLVGSRVLVRGGEAFLVEAEILPFQKNNASEDFDPRRPRRLLLSKKEIKKLGEEGEKKGLTIVPVSLYNKGVKIKVEIAIVRGKKQFDKRQNIKKRETNIEIHRTLKTK